MPGAGILRCHRWQRSANKKLEGAAAFWGRAAAGDRRHEHDAEDLEQLEEDRAVLGVKLDGAEPPSEEENQEGDVYPVWRENWPTLLFFLRLHSQWHTHSAPDGEVIRTGIMRDGIEFELRHTLGIGRRQHPALMRDIRVMEAAALQAMNEVRSAKRERREQEAERRRASSAGR